MRGRAAEDDDEDEEDQIIRDIDDIDELAEDEDGINLFDGNFERDYRNIAQNDEYGGEDIDDEEQEELDPATRRALEARLDKRDRELARRRRMPAAFLHDEDDEDGDIDLTRQPRRRRHHYDEDPDDMEMDIMDEELTLEALGEIKAVNVTEWVSQPAVHRSIYREFKAFLTEFTDKDGISVYGTAIRTLGEINSESLDVSYAHLSETKAIIAYFLANAPTEVLKIFDQAAMETTHAFTLTSMSA
ncbi:MCM DNA helicase complex subunit [Ascosphaera acerosa]|nr:MCM DNA helicase complex subunit [Ascosphaera acerosa]